MPQKNEKGNTIASIIFLLTIFKFNKFQT